MRIRPLSPRGPRSVPELVAPAASPCPSSARRSFSLPGAVHSFGSPFRGGAGGFCHEPSGSCFSRDTQRAVKRTKKRQGKIKKKKTRGGRKPPKVSQHHQGPSAAVPWWQRRCLGAFQSGARGEPWLPDVPKPAPVAWSRLGRASPSLYSTSTRRRTGTVGRIRPAQCRLPPALGSTKVFWSGMVSVVSWVCGTGESKGSAAPSGLVF